MDAGLWCSERMWGLGAYSDAHRDCAVGLEPIECSTLPLQSWVLSGLRVAQLPMACGLWQRFSLRTMCASLIDLCKYLARRCGSRPFSLSTAKLEGRNFPARTAMAGGSLWAIPRQPLSACKVRSAMQVFPAFDQIVNEIAKYRCELTRLCPFSSQYNQAPSIAVMILSESYTPTRVYEIQTTKVAVTLWSEGFTVSCSGHTPATGLALPSSFIQHHHHLNDTTVPSRKSFPSLLAVQLDLVTPAGCLQ